MLQVQPFGLGYTDVASTDSGKIGSNAYKLFGLRVWQRVQQRGIDYAEDCGCSSNAESNSQNGDNAEARGFAQHSQPILKVLNKEVDEIAPELSATIFFEARVSAKFESRASLRFGSPQSRPLEI